MGVKVATATTFFPWSSQPIAPQSSSAVISSPSKRCPNTPHDRWSLSCRFVPRRLNRSALFGTQSSKLHRSKSCELWKLSKTTTPSIRRACSASFDAFSDDEFSRKIEDLSRRFQISNDEENQKSTYDNSKSHSYSANLGSDSVESPWKEMVHFSSIERKANSVELPHSLRIIKRKLKLDEGVKQAGESTYCSINKAFSSMVFIVRELHSFTLHMRELLFYEDLQGILQRVREEMHASFVWLFQQIFSHTPTLMVYVMILLANFTVYSIGNNAAIAASHPPATATDSELVTVTEAEEENMKFDSSSIKTFYVSYSDGKTASVGGNNGSGGGKVRPVASGTDGDGFEGSGSYRPIIPHRVSEVLSSSTSTEPSVSGRVNGEDEIVLWNSILEEAEQMRDSRRDEALDHETMERLVAPVEARVDEEDNDDYFRTELMYQTGLSQEPHNPLLLANYAQFLYLVVRDIDRAEEYFKRAAKGEGVDAEALSKYATFLWKARNDLWAAEEMFLEAISADPTNSYYSANYAHFLWSTGGEDTCFPLDDPQDS